MPFGVASVCNVICAMSSKSHGMWRKFCMNSCISAECKCISVEFADISVEHGCCCTCGIESGANYACRGNGCCRGGCVCKCS